MANSLRSQVLGVAISLMILPIPFVLLRFRARCLTRTPTALDDWILLGALAVNTATCIALIIGATAGNLGSDEVIGPDGLPVVTAAHMVSFRVLYMNQVMAFAANGATKVSILLLYRRIFVLPHFGGVKNAVWLVNTLWIVLMVVWTIGYTFAFIFQCSPVHTFWTHPLAGAASGQCVDVYSLYLSSAITDMLTNVMILGLPVPLVFRLQMPLQRRITTSIVFLLGAFVLAVGVIRIEVFYAVIEQTKTSANLSHIFAKTTYWTIAETAVGIVCACLPTLVPVFKPEVRGSISHGVVCLLALPLSARRATSEASTIVTKNGADPERQDCSDATSL